MKFLKLIFLLFLPLLGLSQDKVMRVYKNTSDSLILVKYPQSKTIPVRDGLVYKWTLPELDTARFFESTDGEYEATITFKKKTIVQPPTVEQIIDDRNPLIKYTSSWVPFTNSVYQDGTAQYTLQTGATASLTFTGNRVEYHAERRVNHGIAGVKIDNGPEVMVDLYNPRTTNVKEMVFVSEVLTQGVHTITIRMTGDKNPAASENNILIDYIKTYRAQ